MSLVVMKFGGTSVGSADRMRAVAQLVAQSRGRQTDTVVVVSAMSTVTDALVSAARHACGKNLDGMNADLQHVHKVHATAISGLGLPKTAAAALLSTVEERLAMLRKLLESICQLGELTPRAQDLILSFGERLSIHLVAQALVATGVPAEPIEASQLIVTSDHFGDAMPHLEESEQLAKPAIAKLLKKRMVPVVTGFMGATKDGIVTTLGRGGSDYSATILGYCLDADEVWIWTDVNGVMSADPRVVPDAHSIDSLSYNEAAELSYFGAKVLHPLTIVPAARKKIPIFIKNTMQPNHPGTKISDHVSKAKNGCKAISTMKNLTLVTLQGKGMLGVPGIAGKVFGAIAAHNINVLFISQASSEFNISFMVKHDDGAKAVQILHDAFRLELLDKTIETARMHNNLAIVAVVGEGMRGHSGVAGQVFSAIGQARINIMAIAQGSSERNISFVIAEDDVTKATQSIHDAFGMGRKT